MGGFLKYLDDFEHKLNVVTEKKQEIKKPEEKKVVTKVIKKVIKKSEKHLEETSFSDKASDILDGVNSGIHINTYARNETFNESSLPTVSKSTNHMDRASDILDGLPETNYQPNELITPQQTIQESKELSLNMDDVADHASALL